MLFACAVAAAGLSFHTPLTWSNRASSASFVRFLRCAPLFFQLNIVFTPFIPRFYSFAICRSRTVVRQFAERNPVRNLTTATAHGAEAHITAPGPRSSVLVAPLHRKRSKAHDNSRRPVQLETKHFGLRKAPVSHTTLAQLSTSESDKMGRLIKNHLARLIVLTAATCELLGAETMGMKSTDHEKTRSQLASTACSGPRSFGMYGQSEFSRNSAAEPY